jgi:hypothetical protein
MADPYPKSQRRLAAILAADVVGSSHLMEADEEGTLSAIRAILSEIIEPTASRHRGRMVKTMGDGAILEFASPVEAVLCAAEAQAGIAERVEHQSGVQAVQLRMGINLGDIVITDDGDILGDSVNVAVRLESIADPGGIDFGAEFGCGPRCPLTSVSGDTLGYWHAKAGHDVEDLAARRGFGLLPRQSPGMEAATNQGFVAHHRHLAQGPPAIVDRLLPAETPARLDDLEVPVPLGGRRLGRVARHCR